MNPGQWSHCIFFDLTPPSSSLMMCEWRFLLFLLAKIRWRSLPKSLEMDQIRKDEQSSYLFIRLADEENSRICPRPWCSLTAVVESLEKNFSSLSSHIFCCCQIQWYPSRQIQRTPLQKTVLSDVAAEKVYILGTNFALRVQKFLLCPVPY